MIDLFPAHRAGFRQHLLRFIQVVHLTKVTSEVVGNQPFVREDSLHRRENFVSLLNATVDLPAGGVCEVQPHADFLGALGAKPLGERGGIIPLPSSHETLEAGSPCGRLGLEFGLNVLQLGKGLGGIAQLQPTHCGHQTVRGWRLQRIHAQLFAFM
ncbi:uncharacterized protein METZ01_LOCUS198466 [marine metagenome]|uniref:Uncharacterized protein n=1 Tax=marine metagenome TaxID=408172 RepID=A0A382E5J8_9ZZZZ